MADGPREVYSHGHHSSVLRSHRWRTAVNSADYLLPRLRDDDQLLDVGCGPGTITVDLAARLPAGRVLGLDSSDEIVQVAQQHAVEIGETRAQFVVGDVYALGFTDDTFDVVHAHQVLQHLRDPIAALQEMRRVCRPGGVVAARDADYTAMTWHPADTGLSRWLGLYHQVARANGGEPDAGRRLRAWAVEAGFTDIAASASAWCFANDRDLSWWSESWADRLTQSSFGQQARQYGFADEDELKLLATAWRTWATAPGAWFSVLHGEVLCTA